jgi:capsular polysaccharide biosynthesis protein
MELKDYWRILRKRGWIILLVAALTAAAAFGFSKLQTVEYKSTIQTFVRPERIDNGTLLATKAILRGFVRFIDSRDFAARVINSLKLDMLPEALINKVTIASIDEDYIIQIDVIDTNGDQANDIAREWATQFVLWRQQDNANQLKQDRVDANIVQDPTYVQFRPQTGLNTAAGGIIGLMIGALIVFFLESIESNILRGPDDVERALSMTVLSAIPVTSAEENRARKKSASMISKPAPRPLLQSPKILDRDRSQRHDPDE